MSGGTIVEIKRDHAYCSAIMKIVFDLQFELDLFQECFKRPLKNSAGAVQ